MRARVALVVFAVVVAGCSGSASDTPFELEVMPEFVNGVYPETGLVLLATVASADDSPVTLTAEAAGASAVVEPAEISPGDVAEVTVTPEAPAAEVPLTVSVSAVRGEVEHTVERETSVVPFTDELGPEAGELFAVFATWLGENRPDLGITPATEADGGAVAPMLLVVTHYAYMSAEWEIGLAWHIMIPPDDWAELYLRPRDEVAPTEAFRLSSRAAAFEQGIVEISEVAPPTEVVR